MDKVELTVEDVNRLLEWRDQHQDEVRRHPTPIKAIEIIIPSTGWHIKGIRDGLNLRLHLNQNGRSFGHCEFRRRSDGMWEETKSRIQASRDEKQSALTVYCSLMALMAYGKVEAGGTSEPRERTIHKSNKELPRKKRPLTTYILRTINGTLLAAPRGSHASPSGIFTVRGHYRHYKSGKVVWIAEYKKGTGKKKPKTYKIGGKQSVQNQG